MLSESEKAAFDAIVSDLDFRNVEKKALRDRRRPRKIYGFMLVAGLVGAVVTFTTSVALAFVALVVAGAGMYGLLGSSPRGGSRDLVSGSDVLEHGQRGLRNWLISKKVLQNADWQSGEEQSVRHYGALVFLGATKPGTSQWLRAMSLLEQYTKREGNAQVPRDHIESGFALGRWIILVRVARKLGDLNNDQIHELDALGMVWSTEGPQ